MVFCPQCGKEVSIEANYCPFCGASLKIDKDQLLKELNEVKEGEVSAAIGAVMSITAIIAGFFFISLEAPKIEWFLFIPYVTTYKPLASVGSVLIVVGFVFLVISLIYGAYCSYRWSKLTKRLETLK